MGKYISHLLRIMITSNTTVQEYNDIKVSDLPFTGVRKVNSLRE